MSPSMLSFPKFAGNFLLLITLFPLATECSTCTFGNWWSSFDHAGLSQCPSSGYHYITGLERSFTSDHNEDYIYHIEGAQCCRGTGRWKDRGRQCQYADWVHSFDRQNTWNKCPDGYFLSGLSRSGGNYLHNIEHGYCCKPSDAPDAYKDCFDASVWDHFNADDHGMVSCGRYGYYITGLYRSTCDLVYCIEVFKCCSMKD